MGDGPSGKMALQGALHTGGVGNPRGLSRGWGAAVAITVEIEPGRTILSHALHLQAERSALDFRVEHSPHDIALIRPEMQKALVVFARDGILRLGKIERNRSILDHHRGVRFG